MTRAAGRLTACFAALLLCACAATQKEETIKLSPVSFAALDGWTQDAVQDALPAFQKSCAALSKKKPDVTFVIEAAGSAQDWHALCAALEAAPPQNDSEARAFFEKHFTPYRVNDGASGLFTGYYEAQLRGAWARGGAYQTPLYARPEDMLTADLGLFKESLKGQKITGKAVDKKFVPYDDRAAVAAGALEGRAKPLLWVDDPIAAFFLEVQGSGQVVMADGSTVRVGYDAQNGHPYTPIGRVLAARGAIEKPVTMQKIRAWLAANPEAAQGVMNENPSVVFFRLSDKAGAVGAQGVVLTPLRSMAVDRAFVPLGVPLWLSSEKQRRLVIAQDTGGAIKGAVRGDLFWGVGAGAEEGAGVMQESGTYYLLLPQAKVRP